MSLKKINKSILPAFILGLSLMVPLFSKAMDGSSGCGPGWYVFKKNSLLSSLLRSTTNGMLMPTVTFGMSFGTSNCSKHSIVKKEKEHIKFATENFYELASDSSKGQGTFLTAYGELMGCSGGALNLFEEKMQKDFSHIFKEGHKKPSELVKRTYLLILKDTQLFQSCFAS